MASKERPKVRVTEHRAKTGPLSIDEEFAINNLVQLARQKQFRTAWTFIQNNGVQEHVRFYNAGVVLQHLSNQYGDIGDLKDDCFLKKELEHHSAKIIELLM